MGNIFKTVNTYYENFESFKEILYVKNKLLWLLIIGLILFFYSFYWYFNKNAFPYFTSISQNQRLIFSILTEIFVLYIWSLLLKEREKIIIKKLNKLFGVSESSYYKLKKMWFVKCVSSDQTKYLEIAEKIDKTLSLKEKYKSNFSFDSKQIGLLFFKPDSKARILTMFMGVCAAIIALSLASGSSIDNVFHFYKGMTFSSIIFLDFLISIFLMFAILIMKFTLIIIHELWILFLDKMDTKNSISKRKTRIFINQLLSFYNLPKSRIRITDKVE